MNPTRSAIMAGWYDDLTPHLAGLRARSLFRRRTVRTAGTVTEPTVGGSTKVNFCANDYLGLSQHPALAAALNEGVKRFGVGAGASQLVTGHCDSHARLEEELAAFTGRERALLFSSGYQANLGAVTALAARGDLIVADRLNHASLNDAAILSRAGLRRFRHGDAPDAERFLATAAGNKKFVLTDALFSMDGDIAPLASLSEAARRHAAGLIVDDAHGFGVLGASGAGTLEALGLSADEVPLLVGTFGKALGVCGAFVAGSADLIETLIQSARTYIYTTAPPPALAEAVRCALRLVRSEAWRRERLKGNITLFREGAAARGLALSDSPTHIQPLLLGTAERALGLSAALAERGFLVSAIRPPTVPRGTARLRITLSAAHTGDQIEQFLDTLEELL